MISMFNFFSRVVNLFFLSRPFAILFAVMSFIVDAINTGIFFAKFLYVFFITFIHISMEFFKRIPQELNATSAVIFPIYSIFSGSTSSHSMVNVVNSSSGKIVTSSIRDFFSKATTGFSVSALQIFNNSCKSISTVTRTFYKDFVLFVSTNCFHDRQSTVLLSNAFGKFHVFEYNMVLT